MSLFFSLPFFPFDGKTSAHRLSNNALFIANSGNCFPFEIKTISRIQEGYLTYKPAVNKRSPHTVMFLPQLKNLLLISHGGNLHSGSFFRRLKESYPVREGSTTPNSFVFPAQKMATGTFHSKGSFCSPTCVMYGIAKRPLPKTTCCMCHDQVPGVNITYAWRNFPHIDCLNRDMWSLQENSDKLGFRSNESYRLHIHRHLK